MDDRWFGNEFQIFVYIPDVSYLCVWSRGSRTIDGDDDGDWTNDCYSFIYLFEQLMMYTTIVVYYK